MFDEEIWRAVQGVHGEKLGEGLVIGHPCGSFKRISCVKLTPLQKHEHRQVKRQNKQSQTHPGNSGSPVVINAYNPALSAEWVVVLHYASGKGYSITSVLDIIQKNPQIFT